MIPARKNSTVNRNDHNIKTFYNNVFERYDLVIINIAKYIYHKQQIKSIPSQLLLFVVTRK